MEELDIATIKKRSIKGVFALTSRTFFLQIIAFAATFLLTIYLTPAIFGVFYIVSAVISFLSYFSDIGLAAALIQNKETLTKDDLTTTFTIQQILVIFLCMILFLVSPYIGIFYNLDFHGVILLRALVISFFLSSLKTIPSVLLERDLNFSKLVVPQIVENIVFYGVAVVLAWQGFGITSFTYAVLLRGICGTAVIYLISPWKISFGIKKTVAKKLLTYGIPFQTNSLLALAKDDLMTMFLGKILPLSQLGYIGWAKKWAEVPLRLIMDSAIRVTFPTFARIQHSKELLGRAIEKTLFGIAVIMFPVSVASLFFIHPVVALIPEYVKWEPAILPFYLFVFASMVSAFSTPLTNTLNAVGKIKITLFLMVFWTIATWVFNILFINLIGYVGVAMTACVLSLTIVLVIYLVKKSALFSFIQSIMYPLLCSVFMAIWYTGMLQLVPKTWGMLVIVGAVGVILYLVTVWFLERKRIKTITALIH